MSVEDILRAAETCDGIHYSIARWQYEQQPEAIKAKYTWKEWQWMGTERDRALERETMPDGPPE